MRQLGRLVAFAAVAGLCTPVSGAVLGKKDRPRYVEGEVIVKFASGAVLGTGLVATRSMAAMAGRVQGEARIAKTTASFGMPQKALVRFPKGTAVEALVARFKAMPEVEYAEPNYIAYIPDLDTTHFVRRPPRLLRSADGARPMTATEVKTLSLSENKDPLGINQVGWAWTGADLIWPDVKGNPIVAVLDTGVDYTHPDLAGKVVKGFDWVNGDSDPMDDNGHGTHVAGIVAAKTNNAVGVAGVSTARIYAIKVLSGEGAGTVWDIGEGIRQAANIASVKVINLSLGNSEPSDSLEEALHIAVNKGKLVVASAGNEGVDQPTWPAFYANNDLNGSAACAPNCILYPDLTGKVMAVAADGLFIYSDVTQTEVVDVRYDCKAQYSQHGPWVTISAPGSAIFSTTPFNKTFWLNHYAGLAINYDYLNGTSMAAPMVAGAAARVLSAFPLLTNVDLSAKLVSAGVPTFGSIGTLVDTDGDATDDTECWPTGNNVFMNDLNVAAAMERGGIVGQVFNASNGVPLTGARVTAYLGTAIKGFGGLVDDLGSELFRIINVPASLSSTTTLTLKVTKSGFATGAQAFDTIDTVPGAQVGFPRVSVPPNRNWWFVTEWTGEAAPGVAYELDQYLYTPDPSVFRCSVGYYSYPCGLGTLVTAPFARSMHDGGPSTGSVSMESTAVRPPLFSTTAAISPYEVFLDSYDDTNGPATFKALSGAAARLWFNGVIRSVPVVRVQDATESATDPCFTSPDTDPSSPGYQPSDCAWHIGNLTSTGIFTPVNELGAFCQAGHAACPAGVSAPGIAPYGYAKRLSILPMPGRRAVRPPLPGADPRPRGH